MLSPSQTANIANVLTTILHKLHGYKPVSNEVDRYTTFTYPVTTTVPSTYSYDSWQNLIDNKDGKTTTEKTALQETTTVESVSSMTSMMLAVAATVLPPMGILAVGLPPILGLGYALLIYPLLAGVFLGGMPRK